MKKKWLCGILIFVLLLLTSCQAAPAPSDEGDESTAEESSAPESTSPQSKAEKKDSYVKQYKYPENVAYTAFLTGSASDGASHSAAAGKIYTLPWNNLITEPQRELNSELSVAMGNRVLSGKYTGTAYSAYDNYAAHEYRMTTGEMFSVSDKTGKLVSYMAPSALHAPGEKVSKEIVIEQAKEFVADLIDLERYTVQYEWDENMNGHHVKFVKTIGEFNTAEEITVTYRQDGSFVLYFAKMQEEFSDDLVWHMSKQTADAIAKAKAEDVNLSFIETTMQNYANTKVEMSIRDCRLIKTEDGRLAALYEIETYVKTGIGNGVNMTQGRLNRILVFDTAGVKVPTETQ